MMEPPIEGAAGEQTGALVGTGVGKTDRGWRGARGRGTTYPSAPGQGRTPPGHTRVPGEELADG
jgi:hypothetical protein